MDSESAAAALPPGLPGRRPIGEFLVERGLVTPDELEAALAQQRLSGQRLGEILVERGLISRMALASVLGEQWEEAGRHLRAVVPVRLADGKEAETGLAGGEELTESLAALQTAVARLEDLAGEVGAEQPASSSGASVAADVLVRLERLETWLREEALGDRLAGALEGFSRDIAEVRAVLAEPVAADDALLERLGRIEDALETRPADGVEERLAALDEWLRGRDDDALGEHVTAALAQLRERIDAVEAAVEAPAERFDRLEALIQERVDSAPDTGVAEALEELGGRLKKVAGLRSEIEELRAAVDREPAPDEELQARLGRIEESLAGHTNEPLATAIDEVRSLLESRPVADPEVNGAIAALHGRLDELGEVRAELGELRAAVGREPAPDEELHARLGRIEESLAGHTNEPLAAAIDEVRSLVESRPVADPEVNGAIAGLHGRLDELGEVRAELGELRAAVGREPAPDEELHARLGRIEESLADRSDVESFATTLHELRSQLEQPPGADPEVVDSLARLRDEVQSLAGRIPTDDHAVLDALAGIRSGLGALRGDVSREPARDEELHERLGRIEESLAHSDVSDSLTGVRSALAELQTAVGGAPARDDELHERLGRLEASLAERTDEGSAGDELVARALAELRTAVDRAGAPDGELHERLGRIESRLADGGVDERTAARLTELREALERAVADDGDLETTLALSTLSDRLVDLRAAVERPDESIAELRERLERIEAVLAAPRDDRTDERLHGIAASLDELRDLSRQPFEPDPELHARLERIETLAAAHASHAPGEQLDRLASEIRDELHGLATQNGHDQGVLETIAALHGRLDELGEVRAELGELRAAVGREPAPDEELHARLGRIEESLAGHTNEPLAAAIDEVRSLLEPRPVADPEVNEAIAALRSELAASPSAPDAGDIAWRVGAALESRLEGIEATMRDALAAPAGPDADDIARRVTAALAAADESLAERLDRLGADLGELRSATRAPLDAADVATHVYDLLAERLAGLDAAVRERPETDLATQLAGRLDEIRAALDTNRNAELAEQLGRIESELRAGLAPVSAAVGGHAQQLEALSGTLVRLDGDVLGRLEHLVERLGGLEAAVGSNSPEVALAGLGQRIDGLRAHLDEPRDADLRAQLDRLESALGELPAAAREAAGGHDAALEELSERLERIEASLADRAEAPQAVLSVDAAPAVAPGPDPEPEGPTSFVAFVPSAGGYRLVDVTGLLPARGGTLDVEGAARVVTRLGRSPLPGDRRRCAFLEAV